MQQRWLATVILLAFICAGCQYDATTPYAPPATPPGAQVPEGLWLGSGGSSAIVRLASDQLRESGERSPATTLTTPSSQLFTLIGVAFDANGDLWIASADESLLLEFEPDDLQSSGSRTATTVIRSIGGSLSAPTALAFDPAHRLWVANNDNGTLVRFDPEQLSAGIEVPAVIISGLAHPTGLAFDEAGTLWVSDIPGQRIVGYRAAQLDVSGAPVPSVVLTSFAGSLVNPAGLAFDASGNLWVANVGGRVVAFSPAQLAASGSPVPRITLSSTGNSLSISTGLAFDAEGSLWVTGGGGTLTKFGTSSLAVTGAPEPTSRIVLPGHSLFWTAAFWPRPTGLPLN